MSAVDRRATRARNFLFGDRRSVEATLAAWAAWRDPRAATRVAALVLRGQAANVLATAAGIRAVEQLRGERFGFALRAELGPGAAAGEALAATGARSAAGPPPLAGAFLIIDSGGRAPEARRLRQPLRNHLEGPAAAAPVLIVDAGPTGADTLRLGSRSGRVERVCSELAAPLMEPIIEAVLADMVGDGAIVVAGVGPRVLQAALGAGDLMIEYAGGAHALGSGRLAELAARVILPQALLSRRQARAADSVGAALAALGVACSVGAASAPEGLLVEPVVGPDPELQAHARVV